MTNPFSKFAAPKENANPFAKYSSTEASQQGLTVQNSEPQYKEHFMEPIEDRGILDRWTGWLTDNDRAKASNELAIQEIAKERGVTADDVYESVGGSRPGLDPQGRAGLDALTGGYGKAGSYADKSRRTNEAEREKYGKTPEGFLARTGSALDHGWDNMLTGLEVGRLALSGNDTFSLADLIDKRIAKGSKAVANRAPGEAAISGSFEAVSEAQGGLEILGSGIRAAGEFVSNPKDAAIMSAEQAPNMAPTIGLGAVGAGIGFAAGNAPGAVIGGKTGMATGSVATEFGAEIEQAIIDELGDAINAPDRLERIQAIIEKPEFLETARVRAAKKGVTIAMMDQLFLKLGGKVANSAGESATTAQKFKAGAAGTGVDAVGEGAGEGLGQYAATGKVDAGEVLQESLLGLPGSAVETAIGATAEGINATKGALSDRQNKINSIVDENGNLRTDINSAYDSSSNPFAKYAEPLALPPSDVIYAEAPPSEAKGNANTGMDGQPTINGYDIPTLTDEVPTLTERADIQPQALQLPKPDSIKLPGPVYGNENTGLEGMPTKAGRMDYDPVQKQEDIKAATGRVMGGERYLENKVSDYKKEQVAQSRIKALPKNFTDTRWLREETATRPSYQDAVKSLTTELIKGGGIGYVRNENDVIVNRTPSINPQWAQDIIASEETTVGDIKLAVIKAMNPKNKLGVKQARIVSKLLDVVEGQYASDENIAHVKKIRAEKNVLRKAIREQAEIKKAFDETQTIISDTDYIEIDQSEFDAEQNLSQDEQIEAEALIDAMRAGIPDAVTDELSLRFDDPKDFASAIRKAIREQESNGQRQQGDLDGNSKKAAAQESSESRSEAPVSEDARRKAEARNQEVGGSGQGNREGQPAGQVSGKKRDYNKLLESVIVAFPDMIEADGGLLPLSRFTPEEQKSIRDAGLVETATTRTNQTYEGVQAEYLWQARKKAQDERVKAKARPAGQLEDKLLTSYTEAELKEKADKQKAQEESEAQATKAAEDKAKADSAVDDFDLTGSDRQADANKNQADIFDSEPVVESNQEKPKFRPLDKMYPSMQKKYTKDDGSLDAERYEADMAAKEERNDKIKRNIEDGSTETIFRREDSSLFYSVTPAANGDKKYQVTVWNKTGPLSDSQHDTAEGIIRHYGYGSEFAVDATEKEFNNLLASGQSDQASDQAKVKSDQATTGILEGLAKDKNILRQLKNMRRNEVHPQGRPYLPSELASLDERINELAEKIELSEAGSDQVPTKSDQAEAKATKAAEDKAKADSAVDDFDLTGSDRQADANPNQTDIFDTETNQPIKPTGNRKGNTETFEFPDGSIQSRADDEVSKSDQAKTKSDQAKKIEVSESSLDTYNQWTKNFDSIPVSGWRLFEDEMGVSLLRKFKQKNEAGGGFVYAEHAVGFESSEQAKEWASEWAKNTKNKLEFTGQVEDKKPKVSANKVFTDDAAEKARAILKSKLGQLNSGFDPELLQAGITLAGYHIEKGARTFSAYARAMVDDMGESIKPFLKSWYMGVKYDPRTQEFEGMSSAESVEKMSIDDALNDNVGVEDAQYTAGSEKQDSATNGKQNTSKDIFGEERGSSRQGTDEVSQNSGKNEQGSSGALDDSRASSDRKSSNKPLYNGKSRVEGSPAGSADSIGSLPDSTGGLFAEQERTDNAQGVIDSAPKKHKSLGLKTTSTKHVSGDIGQIRQRMPFLTDGQIEDVVTAEKRFLKPNGFGMMFTNGTGTGKTFTGLGIVRRFVDQGKNNILIVAPKQTIADAWMKAGVKFFDLEINRLEDINDKGKGIVVTTYANLGQNDALVTRDFDLVIADESHYLSSDQAGSTTNALKKFQSLTLKAGTGLRRVYAQNPELVAEMRAYRADYEASKGSDDPRVKAAGDKALEQAGNISKELDALARAENERIDSLKPEEKPRAVFLSATPFAYDKNIIIGQDFLFDWGGDRGNSGSKSYNHADNFQDFMMTHFGYRVRYGKLTQPDAKVDSGLMERAFNSWLKKEGALAGRTLDSDFDYDRRFILAESAIGKRVDDAIAWLGGRDIENETDERRELRRELEEIIIGNNFKYHARMYFLEAIKAKEALPNIKEYVEAGYKVLVMHDYKKGGTMNPFRIAPPSDLAGIYGEFKSEFGDLIRAFSSLPSPIELLTSEFPNALVYNGNVSAKIRIGLQDQFNSDEDGAPSLMIAQGDAMREGVSIHDTTGKHKRVLIHLGMPVKPTAAIQQEGRIYRTGQASDAIFRYFTIGSNWERYTFASTISQRASTAENLAMGELARGLKESFIEAYEEAGTWEVGMPEEGKGGKARDIVLSNALTPWDMAKSYYFGTKKQGSGRAAKGREGADYFATPEPLGMKMVQWADIRGGESVLEPSAGHGAIGRFFPENTTNKAIEQSDELASKLSLRFNGDVLTGDFEDHNIINKYDAIVMNPPYGSGGKTAADHVRKALKHLRDGGRVVALVPTGPAADKHFDKLLYPDDPKKDTDAKDVYVVSDITLPRVTFERAGTSVSTRVLVLEKQTDKDLVAKIQQSNRDYSSAETIEEFFDRLETSEIKPRVKPIIEDDAELGEADRVPMSDDAESEAAFTKMDSVHSKKGHDLFVLNMNGEMGDNYDAFNAVAKKLGGSYIRAKMRGYYKPKDGSKTKGKPTFSFETAESRDKFLEEVSNNSDVAISEQEAQYSIYEPKPSEVQSRKRNYTEQDARTDDLFSDSNLLPKEIEQSAKDTFAVTATSREVGTAKIGIDRVTSASDAAHVVAQFRKDAQETMLLIVLDKDKKPIEIIRHTKGLKDSSSVDPAAAIGAALSVEDGKYIWLAHNHPSGKTEYSQSDLGITYKLRDLLAGSHLTYQGHVILGKGRDAYAFKDGAMDAGSVKITPASRNKEVSITERKLVKRDRLGATVDSPASARFMVDSIEADQAIILMNTQNEPVAVLSVDFDKLNKLRGTSGRLSRLIKALHKSNAGGAIMKDYSESTDRDSQLEGAKNVARMLDSAGVRVLDHFSKRRGETVSDVEMGGSIGNSQGAFFSRKSPLKTSGLPEQRVKLVADQFLKAYKGADDVRVKVHKNKESLPGYDHERDGKAVIQGMYDASTDTVHLVAGSFDSSSEVRAALQEEILVHKGLGFFSPVDRRQLYADIQQAAKESSEVKALWDKTVKDYSSVAEKAKLNEEQANRLYAEEMFGSLAQKKINWLTKGWSRIKAAIKRLLVNAGWVNSSIGHDELIQRIHLIANAFKNGKRAPKRSFSEDIRGNKGESVQAFSRNQQEEDALEKLGLKKKEATKLSDKIRELKDKNFKELMASYGRSAYEGGFDGLIGIKRAEDTVQGITHSNSGYVGARLATGIADTMTAILHYGAPVWRDGILQKKAGTRGLLDIFGDLDGDLSGWLGWMGGKRAEELMRQGKENNLTQDDIDALLGLSAGKEALFEQVRQDYIKLNKAMLDMAQEAGLIDPTSRARWESEYYIPFYRQTDLDGDMTLLAPRTSRGLSHQTAGIKALKGGEMATNNLLENILTNWIKLTDSSMKNAALLKIVENLKETDFLQDETMRFTKSFIPQGQINSLIREDRAFRESVADMLGEARTGDINKLIDKVAKLDSAGYEQLWAITAPADPDTIRVQKDGKNLYYKVTDPSLLRAVKHMSDLGAQDPLTKGGRFFKRLLTTGVTASPDFILRNFIRDGVHAWAINGDKFAFGKDSFKGLRDAIKEDDDYAVLMFAGASFQGGYVHGTDPERSAQIVRRALEKKGLTGSEIDAYESSLLNAADKVKGALQSGWQHYREVGDKVENANRLATFKAAIKAGKPMAQAVYESKDLMDYSMRGNLQTMVWFTDVIPFLNARLQGLSKLGRAAKENPKRVIASAGLKIAAFSVALAMLNDDDERYQELPDWDKDANWHFWLGEDHWRLPKPFEIGIMFGTLPERMYHTMAGNQEDEKLWWSVKHNLLHTLNINPIPQMFLPIAEVVANRSFFFDTPIEGMSDEGKLDEARYSERTSSTMKELGKVGKWVGLSPKELEHYWNGYLGTLGSYGLMVADGLTNHLTNRSKRPESKAEDWPIVKSFYKGSGPAKSTQYMTDLYDRMKEVEEIYRTINAYDEDELYEQADALAEKHKDKLDTREWLLKDKADISKINKDIEEISRDDRMTASEKRLEIDNLMEERNAIAREASKSTDHAY